MNLYFTNPNSMYIWLKNNGICISKTHMHALYSPPPNSYGDVSTSLKHPQVTQDSMLPKATKTYVPWLSFF